MTGLLRLARRRSSKSGARADHLDASTHAMMAVATGSAAMRFYSFEIVIEKEPEDEGYSAYSPSLPGCFSNGRTIEEARRNMREAIQQHVASLLAHGEPVPPNDRVVQGGR
jgi:antitoxin HicB